MTFYDDMAATANELLAEFGMSMTLQRQEEGAYDPAIGSAPITTTDHAATGAKLDYEQRDIDGTHIRQGDQRVYLAPALAVTPQTADKLLIGGETWSVIASRPLAPAGQTVLHDVQVRK